MNKQKAHKPPYWGQKLLKYILPDSIYETPLGDFEEYFNVLATENGFLEAYFWYWGQILNLLPRKLYNSTYWGFTMLKNYLKITYRTMKNHKGYSFINIFGLAIGIAGCLLITLWVLDELSYDDFHRNAANLYRIEQDQLYNGENFHVNIVPYPMAQGLLEEIPEIKYATHFMRAGGMLFRYKDKAFFETSIQAVDTSFFTMFTHQKVGGDLNTALTDPYSLVISEEIAFKYFGNSDPIGQTINLNNQYDFKITAVIENVPNNSVLQFDILLPYKFMEIIERTNSSWGSNNVPTVVQLHPGSNIAEANDKISALRHKRLIERVRELVPDRLEEFSQKPRVEFSLRPVTDIRLHSYFGYGKPIGAVLYVYIFSIIAVFVLLIACINFMNLSTARSANRAKEVGMRKVIGAQKGNLIKQFYSESIIYAILALIIGLIMVQLFLPVFNGLSGKELTIKSWANWEVLISLIIITLFTGIIAGSYPALFLSSFQPVKVLKGSLSSGSKSSILRKVLVIVQFSLSIILIIGTGIVYNQLDYMLNKDLGYEKEHLVTIRVRGEIRKSYKNLKNELIRDQRILGVTGSGQNPLFISSNSGGATWDGKDPDLEALIGYNPIDYDYVKTMKIEMAQGRDFSKEFATDSASAFVVNEEVVKIMGTQSPIGANFKFGGIDGKIIGVMKNFHYQPISRKIEPIVFVLFPPRINFILIRIQKDNIPETMAFLEDSWEKVIPNYPFEYFFLDERFDNLYRAEQSMGDLLQYFSFFAILIASLGLFGLASFTAEQRTKEIGVRKVLGATSLQIVYLISKEFFILILWSSLAAWPISWFVMNNWLQSFAYQEGISWLIFASATVLALIIATLTVSYQAIKVALANPVDSLKYE